MSGVGVFARLRNLWNGFLSLWIEGVESQHPEAVYEAAIQEQATKYNDLKKAVSGIVYLRNKLEADLAKKSKEKVEVDAQLQVAMDTNEDEVAVLLLEQQTKLEGEITNLQGELAKVSAQAEDSKKALTQFQGEINKLKREKDEMLAKRATAEARLKINNALEGMSTEADMKALEGVRESIHKLEAEADVSKEMQDNSLDAKLAKIKEKTGNAAAKAKLEALKAQRAQQQAASLEAKKSL